MPYSILTIAAGVNSLVCCMADKPTIPPIMFKKKTFVIDADNPWKHDKLARKPIADQLNKIIREIEQPFVMSLASRYGSGKSTFAQCWQADLQNNETKTVFFNAWETDYSKNAFTAFVSCISNEFPGNQVTTKFLDSATRFAGALIRNSPGFALGILMKKITGEGVDDLLEELGTGEDELADYFKNAADESFKAQKHTEETLKAFRISLQKFVNDECNGKLVVFVDDLDRCRPDYAVEVLESIKHFFSVEGLIFVLCIDRTQLINSISGVYGSNLDGLGYYRKFVDWDYSLPAPSMTAYINYLWKDVFDFRSSNLSWANVRLVEDELIKLVCIFAARYELSLRNIEQLFTKINLAYRSKISTTWPKDLVLFSVLLMHCEESNYKEILTLKFKDDVSKSRARKFLWDIYKFCERDQNFTTYFRENATYLSSFLSFKTGPKGTEILVMDGDWRKTFQDPIAILIELQFHVNAFHSRVTQRASPCYVCVEMLETFPTV